MKLQTTEDGFQVMLSRGEKVMETLAQLAVEKEISSGSIQGIGALMNTRIGFYHLHKKQYEEKTFTDEMELVNLMGNFSWMGPKPIVHCHVTLGDSSFRALAGHLFEAECAVTVEIYIQRKKTRVERQFSEEIGLNLWCLGKV